ncbi:hypothetical protein RJ639_046561 [Escallonia herrerae]|uniref:Uncharacterized protein n=1 Tax=Escallonia herrerae TaxID=1293975 RepID=A0AA89AZH5_9ASTE|nr:hypothetical protein RJ639_046561 [Escallonia herrerae]
MSEKIRAHLRLVEELSEDGERELRSFNVAIVICGHSILNRAIADSMIFSVLEVRHRQQQLSGAMSEMLKSLRVIERAQAEVSQPHHRNMKDPKYHNHSFILDNDIMNIMISQTHILINLCN